MIEDLGSTNKTKIDGGPILIEGQMYRSSGDFSFIIGKTKVLVTKITQSQSAAEKVELSPSVNGGVLNEGKRTLKNQGSPAEYQREKKSQPEGRTSQNKEFGPFRKMVAYLKNAAANVTRKRVGPAGGQDEVMREPAELTKPRLCPPGLLIKKSSIEALKVFEEKRTFPRPGPPGGSPMQAEKVPSAGKVEGPKGTINNTKPPGLWSGGNQQEDGKICNSSDPVEELNVQNQKGSGPFDGVDIVSDRDDRTLLEQIDPILVVSNHQGIQIKKIKTSRFSIGTAFDSELTLYDNAVASVHVEISYGAGEFNIKNMRHDYPTYLNDEKLSPGENRLLRSESWIKFGTTEAIFLINRYFLHDIETQKRSARALKILLRKKKITISQKRHIIKESRREGSHEARYLILQAGIKPHEWYEVVRCIESGNTGNASKIFVIFLLMVITIMLVLILLRQFNLI